MNPDSNATSSASLWYFTQNDAVHGPLPFPELVRLKSAGEITADTLVVKEGCEEWKPLSEILSLEANVVGSTNASPPKDNTLTPKQEARSKAVFGCFILFLVSFGLLFLLSHCFFGGADNEDAQDTRQATVQKLMKRVYGAKLREASATEISDGGRANGKLNINVRVNASVEVIKDEWVMDADMVRAFKALYTSDLLIREVTIWNHGDGHGNASNDARYIVSLNSDEESNIDWQNANAAMLEKVWRKRYAHPD